MEKMLNGKHPTHSVFGMQGQQYGTIKQQIKFSCLEMKELENWVAHCQQTEFRNLFRVTTQTLRSTTIVVFYLCCFFSLTKDPSIHCVKSNNTVIKCHNWGKVFQAFPHTDTFFIIQLLYYYSENTALSVLCPSCDLFFYLLSTDWYQKHWGIWNQDCEIKLTVWDMSRHVYHKPTLTHTRKEKVSVVAIWLSILSIKEYTEAFENQFFSNKVYNIVVTTTVHSIISKSDFYFQSNLLSISKQNIA